jgi:uncharacterized protein YidB (DUF937 family)
MDIAKLGKDLLADKLGGGAGGLMEGLSKLTGGGEGALDLGELAGKLQAGGLGDKVQSWLGDGDNAEVSADELTSALGADKIEEMASGMGVDASTAADQLKDALPSLMDKASSGGSLLDKFGGATNAMDMAKGLFK